MKEKVKRLLKDKSLTMPILSFPSTQLIGCTVAELLRESDKQAAGMKAIMDRCPISASLNMMDLSVEAECFGAEIRFFENEIPTVTKGVIDKIEDVDKIRVPKVGDGRTGIYIQGVARAKELMPDKLVLCGVIGAYSLAGRLFDMTELMMCCFDEPQLVAKLLERVTEFLIEYIKAYKNAGADGVVMAEPAAGLLSPELCAEFSSVYVKRIFEAVADENFVLIYHNCGNTVALVNEINAVGADVYHFGNAIDMVDMLQKFPNDSVVMGNLNPVLFRTATAQEIKAQTLDILQKCNKFDNFVISSGCDIPADSRWENIDAYFNAIKEYYEGAK